jgi:hypothetical protein
MRENLRATLLSCVGLGTAWQPGRVVPSSAGCWVVEAAPTYDPKEITVLQPRDLTRPLSKAVPPPDWRVVPEEQEGWAEMLPSDLEHASAARCGRS